MVVSSVSPDRCDITLVYPARFAISTAASVSVSEAIWVTLMRMELPTPWAMPGAQPLHIRHEKIVADKLASPAHPVGHELPAFPVILGHSVFDRHDRVTDDDARPYVLQ